MCVGLSGHRSEHSRGGDGCHCALASEWGHLCLLPGVRSGSGSCLETSQHSQVQEGLTVRLVSGCNTLPYLRVNLNHWSMLPALENYLFSLVVKTQIKTPTAHAQVNTFDSCLQLLVSASCSYRPWMTAMMVQVSGY